MRKQGCEKEQKRQYISYVGETSKTNNELRQKIQSQKNNNISHQLGRKINETPRALIAILPVPEMGNQYSNHDGKSTTMKHR